MSAQVFEALGKPQIAENLRSNEVLEDFLAESYMIRFPELWGSHA